MLQVCDDKAQIRVIGEDLGPMQVGCKVTSVYMQIQRLACPFLGISGAAIRSFWVLYKLSLPNVTIVKSITTASYCNPDAHVHDYTTRTG